MASTSKSRSPNERAELLKNQGNELHQDGNFHMAYRKYTEAIKEDPKNAIYFANRAATSLALKQYMDAASDARKATELDPKYGKAWARLATARYALSIYASGAEAWKEALRCLPSDDKMSETDMKLKTQYQQGLRKAEKALSTPVTTFRGVGQNDIMPWTRAQTAEDRLRAEQKISSAFVILYAYNEFKRGVETMKMLKKQMMPTGQLGYYGKPDALADISNGLMRDPRVFHFDCTDWLQKYNTQVLFEFEMFKASNWVDAGPKQLKEELPKKVKRDGWQSTRDALAVTVRAWMMCGNLATATGKISTAVEYHSRVMDLLNWGSRVWQDISDADRGCIFKWTFIRGAKRLHIAAIHSALVAKVEDCSYTKEDLADMCRDLLAEAEIHPPPSDNSLDPGFFLSFWEYPKAEALSILGWYHMQLALVDAKDAQTASENFMQAAEYYLQATSYLPTDDEKYPYFLRVVVESYLFNNRPLKEVMPVIARMTLSMEEALQFWENSPASKSRNEYVHTALEFGRAAAEAHLPEESIAKPRFMQNLEKWPVPNIVYL